MRQKIYQECVSCSVGGVGIDGPSGEATLKLGWSQSRKPWAPASHRAEKRADGTQTSAVGYLRHSRQHRLPTEHGKGGAERESKERPHEDRDQKFGFFSKWDGEPLEEMKQVSGIT